MNGGTLYAALSNLTLNEGLTMTGGSLFFPGFDPTLVASTLNLASGSTSSISGGSIGPGWTVNNSGTVNMTAGGAGSAVMNNLAGATWNVTLPPFGQWTSTTFNNAGTFVFHGDFGDSSSFFQNSGSVTGDAGSVFSLAHGNGNSTSSGTITVGELVVGDQNFNLTAGATVNADLVFLSEGFLYIAGNSTLNANLEIHNLGTLEVKTGATLTLNGSLKQLNANSNTHLSGGTITNSQALDLQAGGLSGAGVINGNVSNNAIITPGGGTVGFGIPFIDSPGAITINGNLTLLSDSKIVMEIGGLSQGTQYDYLAINGMAALNGTLVLEMINAFQMQLNGGQIFTLLTSGDVISGAFTNVANGERLVTADGTASFQVNYGPGSLFDPDNLVLSEPEIVPEPGSCCYWRWAQP